MIGLLSAVLPSVMEVAGRFLPEDKEKRAAAEREIQAKLTDSLAQVDLAQLGINKVEAAHRSMFVAGWRPFIGWTCGVALMPVLMGMLGLGGLRSWEKVKGVDR